MHIGRVSELWRYPVKSMRGDRVGSAPVTERWGVPGDRGWVISDRKDGEIRTAKSVAELLQFHARYLDEPQSDSTPAIEITFPDGSAMFSDDDRIHDALSAALGREVRLSAPRETNFDAEPLSLLTTTAMASLQADVPEAVIDPRRFRKNIIVATEPGAGDHPEFDWVGRRLSIGETTCAVVMRIVRCRMVTLPQAELPLDRSILRSLARDNGAEFGVYLRVATPGTIHEGDPVTLA